MAVLWIRIRIGLALLDTGNADPNPGPWKLTELRVTNDLFPAFQKGFCTFVRTIFSYPLPTGTLRIFFRKNSTFCDLKV
jgi:hypothetical protein